MPRLPLQHHDITNGHRAQPARPRSRSHFRCPRAIIMEPTTVPDYATPSTPIGGEELPPRKPIDWLFIILQIGHRAVSLAVFVMILTVAGIKTKYLDPHPLARIAFILADMACLCAVGGWYFAVVRRKPMRESLGLLIFSLIIAVASLVALMRT